MSRDLDDMIGFLKATNPELLPIFVAKDLHKVPSVSFDHIDCARLVREIAGIKNQMN